VTASNEAAPLSPPDRLTPEQRRRNMYLGWALGVFVLAVVGFTIAILGSTGYNPFAEDPQFIIKPKPSTN